MKNPVKKNMDKLTKPATHKDRKKEQNKGYEKHKGKEVPVDTNKPTIAYLDADMILFAAASSAEQIYYVYKDQDENEVARFKSAKEGKNWLEQVEMLGVDPEFGYEGSVEDLTRHTEYEIGTLDTAIKNFKSLVNRWAKKAGVEDFVVYVSRNTGDKNFRHELATVKAYKTGRSDLRKPHYLEPLRAEVSKLPYVKLPRGNWEVDDVVCALAQRAGKKAVACAGDKDVRQVVGCWYLVPDEMEKPTFSHPSTVGKVGLKGSGSKAKIIGMGNLFLLSQVLTGDKADTYDGCKGIGVAKAYKILEPFSGKPKEVLPEVINTICDTYRSVYGDKYQYIHCHTGEQVDASWKDIMIEQVRLAYMLKHKADYPSYIVDLIEEYYIANKNTTDE